MTEQVLDALTDYMIQPDEILIPRLISELNFAEKQIAENEKYIWRYTRQLNRYKAQREKIMSLLAQIEEKKRGDALEKKADTPQADEIGDCNICRFAGCSECDDCINGSEWVRETEIDDLD